MPQDKPRAIDIRCAWCEAEPGMPCDPNSMNENDYWSSPVGDLSAHRQRNDDAYMARQAVRALNN